MARSPIADPGSVPGEMQTVFDAVTALTDRVCRAHLNDEYGRLARRMAAALCREEPSPLASGQPRTWACGIVHLLGQLNFLTDPATVPFMTTADLCAAFGVGQSTAHAKAQVIRRALDPHRLDAAWMLPGRFGASPLGWLGAVHPAFVARMKRAP